MALPDAGKCRNNVGLAAEIFTEYGDFIHTTIRYQVKNETQADDLFQDFFLSLVASPLPTGVRNIRDYLYRAITNDVIDATRRVERYLKHVHKYSKYLEPPIDKRTPEDAFIETEETKKMFELIEMHLRCSHAQAITLRYRDDYDIKEVAKKMNVDSGTVRKYIYIGLSKIRCFLKPK